MDENYFLLRKSCRNFKQDKVSNELLERIIEQAVKAPTCGNMQLYSIILTEDHHQRKKLAELHYNQPAASSAPLILTICADFNRFTKWCKQNKADIGFNNFHSFITALIDGVILAQQIVTIAELEGLGSCYLGTVTYNAKEISEFLKLPDLVVPVASISLGLPNVKGDKTDRLPLKAVLHKETYRKETDQDIAEFYKIHENNPENKKFIEENGKENLAQVFAEIRYPKTTNELLSEKFMNLIKEKGFLK